MGARQARTVDLTDNSGPTPDSRRGDFQRNISWKVLPFDFHPNLAPLSDDERARYEQYQAYTAFVMWCSGFNDF